MKNIGKISLANFFILIALQSSGQSLTENWKRRNVAPVKSEGLSYVFSSSKMGFNQNQIKKGSAQLSYLQKSGPRAINLRLGRNYTEKESERMVMEFTSALLSQLILLR